MNGKLAQAIEAAEARKCAVLAADDEDGVSLNFSNEDQSRAIVSGFDIDYDELITTAHRAGRLFAAMSLELPSVNTHEAAWSEGLIVGMFFSLLPTDELH